MKGTTQGSGIVQLEGAHILRSTGRKDRHSKVYTTKGPRDRRVRLSAQTAIQFYDVQDRLGYDRPSKAVDWLINKAKPAIDKLNEFASAVDSNPSSNGLVSDHQSEAHSEFGLTRPDHNPGCCKSSFMASPGDQPDANFINTMKPFFATTNFPGFSSDDISVSRESFPARDLGISLQSVPGSFQRIDGWNNGGDMDNRVEILMSSMENSQQAAAFSHRDLLQSNLAVNPWNQRPLACENQHNHQTYSSKTSDFESPFGMGFHVPARIYGDGEVDNHR